MKNQKLLPLALAIGLATPGLALATNGYFSHGYGVKSQGVAGVGIALPQDGLAAATNPAGTAFVGDRADIGVTWFQPQRGVDISGNNAGPGVSLDGSYDGNDSKNFLIPEIGYTKQLNKQWAVGIAVYGNGGMNTDYGRNPWAAFGATGSAGVNLEQLFVSPNVAFKITPDHAVGLALNLAYQSFEAKGIGIFAGGGGSESPANFSDRGADSSYGIGFRVGYTGKVLPSLTVGATYASKTKTSEFDKYKGLFAEQGGFDIPANYGVGLAWQATRQLTLAADVQRIDYSDVKSVGNPLATGTQFGSSNGPGFGWKDVTTVKIGASFEVNPDLTLRAGYSHATQPIPSDQVFLNILAPGVVQDHLSLGTTWKPSKNGELSVAYTHAFKETVSGAIPAANGGGQASIHLQENILAIAYGWKY
jgi:long-chain fatty acid transport protein